MTNTNTPDRIKMREAASKAFEDHVGKLFDVYCANVVALGADEALRLFRNGFRVAAAGFATIDHLLADPTQEI